MKILYEDRHLILCEKPVGVLSQRGKEGESDMLSLLDAYLEEKGERATAYVLHRLDESVGGLMVYAKHQKAAATMSEIIARGDMIKEYLAIVEGDLADMGGEGELFDLLFKDPGKNKSYVVKRVRKGVKEARLSYRTLGVAEKEGKTLTLVAVRLYTGRTHQIRVQFSSRRHPLVGDGRYGSKGGKAPALYSYKLTFTHPFTGKKISISAGMPSGTPWELFDIT